MPKWKPYENNVSKAWYIKDAKMMKEVLRIPYSSNLKNTKFSLSCPLTSVPLDTVFMWKPCLVTELKDKATLEFCN